MPPAGDQPSSRRLGMETFLPGVTELVVVPMAVDMAATIHNLVRRVLTRRPLADVR